MSGIRMANMGPRKSPEIQRLYKIADIKQLSHDNRDKMFKHIDKCAKRLERLPYGKRSYKMAWNESIISIHKKYDELLKK